MRLFALLAAGVLVGTMFAAPVPKEKEKTTEQKLVGKWRPVPADGTGNTVLTDGVYFIIFKEKGQMEERHESGGGKQVEAHTGTYKVTGDDQLEYTVERGGEKQTVKLTIDKLTDKHLEWTGPDKKSEAFERVQDEPKKEEKKDK